MAETPPPGGVSDIILIILGLVTPRGFASHQLVNLRHIPGGIRLSFYSNVDYFGSREPGGF